MERTVAIKKLGKILGKSLGYRVDPKAPDQDDRDEAQAKLRDAVPRRKALEEELAARRTAVLEADAEYRRIGAEYRQAKKDCDELFSIAHHYRFTAGTSNGMFFHIKAQGDSWEEVLAKLTEKQNA